MMNHTMICMRLPGMMDHTMICMIGDPGMIIIHLTIYEACEDLPKKKCVQNTYKKMNNKSFIFPHKNLLTENKPITLQLMHEANICRTICIY